MENLYGNIENDLKHKNGIIIYLSYSKMYGS